jgi:predicted nucleotidyltransferase
LNWPQHWLGEIYSRLYAKFGRETFTLSQATSATGKEEGKLSVAFSKLHDAGVLILFARTRPRVYRLLDPRNLLLKTSGEINEERLPQEAVIQLVDDAFRVLRDRVSLTSFAIYGSFARGEAKPTSDVDILLVSDEFEETLASRIDSLAWVDRELAGELEFLARNGYRFFPSFYPLRMSEALTFPVLFLDMTEDAKIIHDKDDFLKRTLARLSARLELMGARRIRTGDGRYWDLGTNIRPGEEIVA